VHFSNILTKDFENW